MLHSEIVWSEEEYLKRILELNRKDNLFVTVYTFKSDLTLKDTKERYSKPIIDTIYIDLDFKDDRGEGRPIVAFFDLIILLKLFISNGIIPRIYFSGNKGFNLYLDFEPIELFYPKQTIRRFVEQLERKSGIKTIDWQIIGDISRVSRIPNTFNMKGKRYCIPLVITDIPTVDDDITLQVKMFTRILDLSQNMRIISLKRFNSPKVRDILQQIDNDILTQVVEIKPLRFAKIKRKRNVTDKIKGFRPCILEIYNLSKTNIKMSHEKRIALCREAISCGFDKDEIVDFYKHQTDFDEEIAGMKASEYYVDKMLEGDLQKKRVSCKTLWKWGICSPERCSKAKNKIEGWKKNK